MKTKLKNKLNSNSKLKTILSSLVILALVAAVFAGVWQIDQVREFFGQASGTPANLVVDTQGVTGPMPRPWRNLAQGGEDHDWRIKPITPQVKALNPQYIRIDHIYDFYDIVQGSPGNLSFDFSQLDVIINDILATGAKPYIALSYMPPAIASGDIVSKPQRWQDWQLTVQKTIEHISGTRAIPNVYYEVWNEPDLFGGWKYYGNKNYLTLYSYAALGAQQAKGVRNFYLGGPGITALYKNWFLALTKHALQNNLKYDFFSWHRYSHQIDQFKQDTVKARSWLYRYPQLIGKLQLHVTEWGPDSENHPGYDSQYAAAHTVAGAISMTNNGVQKTFSFEIQDGKGPQEYWGRWGMLTHQDHGSKAKPRYEALKMLDQIGTQRLNISGQGTWVKGIAARNIRNNPTVVLSNFDPQGAHTESVPLTFENIQPGSYQFRMKFLNGRQQTQQIATSAAVLRTQIPMSPNTVMFGELIQE